jgi:nitrile hydratase
MMAERGHHHSRPPSPVEARAAALEALLIEKGLLSPEFIDSIVNAYANDIGPMNGAKIVARAWVDREYRERLLADGTAAIAEQGFGGPEAEHMVWDSSAEVRYLVLPERPAGTEGISEEKLANLVTRDAMIGVARL